MPQTVREATRPSSCPPSCLVHKRRNERCTERSTGDEDATSQALNHDHGRRIGGIKLCSAVADPMLVASDSYSPTWPSPAPWETGEQHGRECSAVGATVGVGERSWT